jgi:YVTN family beta-propeller protein
VIAVCALAVVSGIAGSLIFESGHGPLPRLADRGAGVRLGADRTEGVTPTYGPTAAPRPSAEGASVARTLVLFNDTFVPGNFVPGNGIFPTGIASDPSNGMTYVVDQGSYNVTVIDSATATIVGTIPTGLYSGGVIYDNGTDRVIGTVYDPAGLSFIDPTTDSIVGNLSIPDGAVSVAYDSGMHELFVTGDTSNNVTVVDDSTDQLVTTIPVLGQPESIAYDPALGELFVGDTQSGYDHLSVISDVSNSVVANISLADTPGSLLYDPLTQDIYVANGFNVSVVSPATNQEIANITLSGFPTGLAYDAALDEVWTTGGARGNVTILDALTNSVVTNVSLPNDDSGLQQLTYDGAEDQVWVTGAADQVTVVSDLTDTIVRNITTGATPSAFAFDTAKDEFYVALGESYQVQVISAATGLIVTNVTVGADPTFVLYDGGRGEIFVANYFSYNVTVINDTTNTAVASIPVDVGLMAYDPTNGEVFGTSDYGGVVVVNDTSNAVVSTLEPSNYTSGLAYVRATGQLFISSEDQYNITVVNATSLATVTTIDVLGFPYLLTYDSGVGEVFVQSLSSTDVWTLLAISVATDHVVVTLPTLGYVGGITYDPATGGIYVINDATGGTIAIVSDSTDSVVGAVSVGLEPIGEAYDSVSRQVWVANFACGTLSVLQQAETFPVNFSESGLPSGTSWSVVLGGATESSTGSSLAFNEPNGSYLFTVPTLTGYTASPASGSLQVDGGSVTQTLQFTPQTATKTPEKFPVTFSETGLTQGTPWTVTLNGASQSSDNASLQFQSPNGTVAFSVGILSGFTVVPASGTVTVAGQPLTEALTFASSTGTTPGKNGTGSGAPSTVLGLPATEGYLLIVLVILLLLVMVVVAVRMRRGKSPPTGTSPEAGSPPETG